MKTLLSNDWRKLVFSLKCDRWHLYVFPWHQWGILRFFVDRSCLTHLTFAFQNTAKWDGNKLVLTAKNSDPAFKGKDHVISRELTGGQIIQVFVFHEQVELGSEPPSPHWLKFFGPLPLGYAPEVENEIYHIWYVANCEAFKWFSLVIFFLITEVLSDWRSCVYC